MAVKRKKISSAKESVLVSKKSRTTKVLEDIAVNSRNTYRNFFNGGTAFTLLEGYCFHTITRRFIRQDIGAKRNSLLEQAALEYALNTNYPSSNQQLYERRKEIAQRTYKAERALTPEFFEEEEGLIKYSSAATSDFTEGVERWIDDKMITSYIGARYTVKNLPEYRKLYTSIRKTLKTAMDQKQSMNWWDAAIQTDNSSAPDTIIETMIDKDMRKVRQYFLAEENGENKNKYFYFDDTFSKEYILPLQNSASDLILRDSAQKEIIFHPPTKLSNSGFEMTDKSVTKSVRCFSGLFEVRDAYMFGLHVLCSVKASESFAQQQAGKNAVDFIFQPNPQAQVEWICKTWNFLYYTNHNGGFTIYDPSETDSDIAAQDFVTSQSTAPFVIPAVYDITLGPIRKIRMPFIAFLNPMTLVEWNSSASIGEMISFYYQPAKGRNFFMTISNTIDFSTVEDYNTMEIDLVDAKWKDRSEVPDAIINQEDKKTFVEILIIPDKQTDTWQKIYESPVTKIPAAMIPLWEDKGIMKPEFRVPALYFFTLMEAWNPSLFLMSTEDDTNGWSWVDGIRRVDKKANKLYGSDRPNKKVNFPDIEYCFSLLSALTAERIFMKFPFMSNDADYTAMEEYDKAYILVYNKGAWSMELKESVKVQYQIGAI